MKDKIKLLVVAIMTYDGSVSGVRRFEFDELPINKEDYENMIGGQIDWDMNPLEDVLDELSKPESHVEVNLVGELFEDEYEHNYLIVRV